MLPLLLLFYILSSKIRAIIQWGFGGEPIFLLSNLPFRHLPRSLDVLLDVCDTHLARATPAGQIWYGLHEEFSLRNLLPIN